MDTEKRDAIASLYRQGQVRRGNAELSGCNGEEEREIEKISKTHGIMTVPIHDEQVELVDNLYIHTLLYLLHFPNPVVYKIEEVVS